MPSHGPPRRIVIAGGSGFLGQSLTRSLLAQGCEVSILSRSRPTLGTHVPWDARTLGPWTNALANANGIVNLVGRTVDCIKTPDHCDEILRSRVEATTVLGAALRQHKLTPRVWVQMSTAHIYGDPPEVMCDEDSAFGYGLAPTVGKAWEQAFCEALPTGTRPVILRTSFVLGRDGGALHKLARVARLGAGGRAGHGRQGMSWIHETDMNALFERAITDDHMQGVYIATAPNPVSNAVFMRTLRKAVRMPIGLPAPAFLVRIGAPLIMRTDPELALYGRYCRSRRLEQEGFQFQFPTIDAAMTDLFSRRD
jgi:uncharacterized protein (TIGR01777 family)